MLAAIYDLIVFKYRTLFFDSLMVLFLLVAVAFETKKSILDIFLSAAFAMALLRLGYSIASLKQDKKSKEDEADPKGKSLVEEAKRILDGGEKN